MNNSSNDFINKPIFSLVYDTRSESEEFLKIIYFLRKKENIDFWFFSNTYEVIEDDLMRKLKSLLLLI